MEFFLISLLSQFIFFNAVWSDSTAIPNKVTFEVLTECYEEIQVNLIPTDTFLANKNVPVWTSQEENPTELIPRNNVMEELTPFTVYQDPYTRSAAIYFHKRREFEGTIGHHHIIHGLKYNLKTKRVQLTSNTVFPSPLDKHNENRFSTSKQLIMKTAGDKLSNWNKSLRKYPDTVYVETLVMISHDITENLKYDYTSIVTYVLTLFNTVDMLYSKIEVPNIRINIAGIIIGTSQLSFPELNRQSCYVPNNNNDDEIQLDADCTINAIKSTLYGYQKVPVQSYDIVIFLAKSPIYRYASSPVTRYFKYPPKAVHGLASSPTGNNGFRESLEHTGIAIISDRIYLKFFPTVAHEIAHLLGVPHDGGLLWKEDGTCDAHIMKKDSSFCSRCLTFGGTTPEYLKMFFGSRDGCIFHNKPRSLNNPPGPRSFWNADEQCQCYGYRNNYKPRSCLPIRHLFSSTVKCESRLKCVDENNRMEKTSIYMDGTPCDKNGIGNKICWNKQCVPVQNDNEE